MGTELASAFQRGISTVLADIRHEGPLNIAPPGTETIAVQENGIWLSFAVDRETDRVVQTRHAGAASSAERATLETLCAIVEAERMTIQEAADHGILKALHSLQGSTQRRIVPGILLPQNADPMFGAASRLVRALRRSFVERVGRTETENEFDAPPAAPWRALSDDERLDQVARAAREFLEGRGRNGQDLRPIVVEQDILGFETRVVVAFADNVPKMEMPGLVRGLERHLKNNLEPKLQVLLEPLKDKSAIRRL